MNYYIITGTSSGIGRAVAELLLKDKENFVIGISRTQTINSDMYQHIHLDLSDIESVKKFEFPEFKDASSVCLVNNAIFDGEILHFENTSQDDVVKSYNVNIISPALLCNSFLKKYRQYNCKRIILNISSGAAKIPIESWGIYCSSKAALLMLSQVIDAEQKSKYKESRVYVFSVSPGVVDTNAQQRIRNTSEENFSLVKKFIEYKEKNELADASDVAARFLRIVEQADKNEKVELNVKDF